MRYGESVVVRGMSALVLVGLTVCALGCSSGGSGTNPPPVSGANVVALTVDGGPPGLPFNNGNVAFASLTVCVPGSTSQCQPIDHLLVDTGSFGLRLLSSASGGEFSLTTVPLPQEMNAGNPVGECVQYLTPAFTWGSVRTADVKTSGGEVASSIPVNVIGDTSFNPVPTSATNPTNPCATGGDADSLLGLGANGILGVGPIAEDCPACATQVIPATYYSCPTPITTQCTGSTIPLAQQVSNPVASFATDNNGVVIEIGALSTPTGATSLSGQMLFGIGTQSNNALGSAQVYQLDDFLSFTTTYKGKAYPGSFVDSGSNGIFFLDSTTTGLPLCSSNSPGFYCPSSTQQFTAANMGTNMTSPGANVMFNAINVDNLALGVSAFDGTGPQTGDFDWGMPFFFGRTVYSAIFGKSAPGGTPPYVAY